MTHQSDESCPICGSSLPSQKITSELEWTFVDCIRCGKYALASGLRDILGEMLDSDADRALVSHHVYKKQGVSGGLFFGKKEIVRILQQERLPSPVAQADQIILKIGNKSKAPGDKVSFDLHKLFSEMGAISFDSIGYVLEALKERRYIDYSALPTLIIRRGAAESDFEGIEFRGPVSFNAWLTFDGWVRHEELVRGLGASNLAFMAMKFGDAQLDRIVDSYFRKAVRETGFDLQRLDENQPAGLIDDQMRVKIRLSAFMISDLTHANLGAYWEAGYAEGLGKPVIYTCRRDVFIAEKSRPHFDTNHHLTVIWSEESIDNDVLRLKATIRATFPNAIQIDS